MKVLILIRSLILIMSYSLNIAIEMILFIDLIKEEFKDYFIFQIIF